MLVCSLCVKCVKSEVEEHSPLSFLEWDDFLNHFQFLSPNPNRPSNFLRSHHYGNLSIIKKLVNYSLASFNNDCFSSLLAFPLETPEITTSFSGLRHFQALLGAELSQLGYRERIWELWQYLRPITPHLILCHRSLLALQLADEDHIFRPSQSRWKLTVFLTESSFEDQLLLTQSRNTTPTKHLILSEHVSRLICRKQVVILADQSFYSELFYNNGAQII